MSHSEADPVEGTRRARHTARARTLRRITVAEGIGRVLERISPGEFENRPRVWVAAIIGGLVAFALIMVRLFVPSVVGMGDNGDGFRLLCGLGLGNDRPFLADPSLAIYPQWSPTGWYGLACPQGEAPPFSSYYLLAGLARLLSIPFGGGLDLRILGALLALVVAALLVALIRYLPGSTPFRLVVAGGILFFLLDASFADFFVSADLEGTELVAVLAAFVSLLILWGGYAERVTTIDVPPRGVLALSLAVVIALLVTSTSLIALAFVPGFIAGLLWVPRLRDAERARSRPVGRVLRGDRGRAFARGLARRVPAIVASVLLLGIAAAQVAAFSARDHSAEVYDSIFRSILPSSSTPETDLEWFGLDEGLADASGQPPTSVAASRVFADPAFARIGATQVVLFHVTHPERMVALADRGMAALASPRLENRGNFLDVRRDDEGELVHDQRWVPAQWGSQVLYSVPLLIPAGQIAGLLVALALAFAHTRSVRSRSLGWATFFLLLGSALIFWTTLLGPHIALAEALLPSTLVMWLSIPLVVACAAIRVTASPGSKSAVLDPMPKNSWIAAATRIAAPPSP